MRCFVFLLLFPLFKCYHILLLHNMGTKSHLITMKPVLEEMLERGHKVTSIIYSTLELKNQNYTEIIVPSVMDKLMVEASAKMMEKGGTDYLSPSFWLWIYNLYKDRMKNISLDVFSAQPVLDLIKTRPKVDGVIVMSANMALFAEIFDCPVITFMPNGMADVIGGTTNLINHSIQPTLLAPHIEPMTFVQRIKNHAISSFFDIFMRWWTHLQFEYQEEFFREELGLEMKEPTAIMRSRSSILLAASHPITHGAWQYLPNIIQVGGLQLKEAKPLEGKLKEFMDSATEGAVLVSFGSALKPEQMPPEKIQVFIDTFKNLGMKVVWKWNSEMPGLPDNIFLSSWIPQQDLLGHPNLKVFVTHGGLGSLVEAIYHKAVIVGVPLSNDQKPNLLRAVRHGYAVSLVWDDMTAEELVGSIKLAMEDKAMAANLERIHQIYMDREQKPVEKAAWWVEYVCRHGTADWLKSIGEEVPFYQYHHLDIILFLTTLLLICLTATFFFWRTVFRCCCGKKDKPKTE